MSTGQGSNDVLGELRRLQARVTERIRELEPLEQELADLRRVADQFGTGQPTPAGKDASAKPTSRPAVRKPKTEAPKKRRARRAPGGSRADQVAGLVEQQPGITIAEAASALEVDSTGLYRVVRQLQEAGRITKAGRQLHPAAAAQAAASD